MGVSSMRSEVEHRNCKVAVGAALFAFGMLGLAYASVPLYRLFCQVTGYAGTTQRVAQPSATVLDRMVTIRFDANVAAGLSWTFKPERTTIDVKIGENTLAFYRATNTTDRAIVGSATFNVTPEIAGGFFNKIECFCFKEQRIEPGQTIDMPVSFYVDPSIVKDKDASKISTITLSYTFYPVDKPKAAAAGGANAGNGT